MKKPKKPEDKPLTPFQREFVKHYKGNKTEAAIAAGTKSKTPDRIGFVVFSYPHVRAAIEKKEAAFFTKMGEREAQGVKITRNTIINRLDLLSLTAESESARVMALAQLKDIFGLSAKNSDNDLFAGWTDEELESYHETGELPPRFGQVMGQSSGDTGNSETPEA